MTRRLLALALALALALLGAWATLGAEQLHNFGETTVNEVLDASETTVTVTDGSVFPASGTFRVIVDDEIMRVTARSSNDLTVVRGTEGTSAATHAFGADIVAVLTAESLEAIILEAAVPSGSAFPGSPSTHDRFYRTDLRGGLEFFYDGTRWLSTEIFSIMPPAVVNATADIGHYYLPLPTDMDTYLTTVEYALYVTGSVTWVSSVGFSDFDNALTTLASESTAGQTASKLYHVTDTVNTVVNSDGGNSAGLPTAFDFYFDEQTGSSAFYGGTVAHYRLVGP